MFKKIDRKSQEIMSALATAPVFKKHGLVHASPAIPGEVVVTTLESGAQETVNSGEAGEWVITNPSGERDIISHDKFFSRYEPTSDEGVYLAKGCCKAIRNPYGEPIEILASWGSAQDGDENCMIADTCDASGENMNGEPYLIDAHVFRDTYTQI